MAARSHQTGVIDNHWNDLPTHLAPKLRSINSSSSSSTPLPLSSNNSSPSEGSGDSPGSPVDASAFPTVLEGLFASPSALPPNELKVLRGRVEKALDAGGIRDDWKAEVGAVVDAVVAGRETPKWGRERLVEFMVREKGVALWGASLRKVVEGVRLEE